MLDTGADTDISSVLAGLLSLGHKDTTTYTEIGAKHKVLEVVKVSLLDENNDKNQCSNTPIVPENVKSCEWY